MKVKILPSISSLISCVENEKYFFSKFLYLSKQQKFTRTGAGLFSPENHSDGSQSRIPTSNLIILLMPVGTVAKKTSLFKLICSLAFAGLVSSSLL